MQLSPKAVTIAIVAFISIWLLHAVQPILSPFILAAIFAYILNPAVNFLQRKFHFSRNISVFVIYTVVVAVLIVVAANAGLRLTRESKELGIELRVMTRSIDEQLDTFPEWGKPIIKDISANINIANIFAPQKIWPYFSGAISGLVSFFIFLIAGFYFLQAGKDWLEKLAEFLPHTNKVDITILFKKANQVLNDYLRGQIFLILLMATVSWLALSFLQVKYALIIGIFTGFAEIIPIIGPIAAGTMAVVVAIFDGVASLGLPPLFQGLVVAAIYFLFRQIEDVFVIPHVLGHATRLHPLVVLFAVMAGGHLWGILGMILAVPIAALIRILLEFALSKIA